jgi:hypothetical protein
MITAESKNELVCPIATCGNFAIAESNLANASGIAARMYAIDRCEIIFHGAPGTRSAMTRS